ncbi:hypothetical protein PQU94_09085 [Asticcacaulis sp. DXS10W]|uniref:Uncharacterized protein n=1 Tax=Asticcacaulis currens TaxID=2984210 RepID=A0ABT5IE43_9CAUL|nr:hypothetical protein [Asticcacaulis currens]MDC7694434.1 hypothetical protein [Asticcacaulis currens]
MKANTELLLILIGNAILLAFIYLPYAFKTNLGIEIIVPGIYNIGLIIVDFGLALILSLIPSTRGHAKWWWLAFGIVLLASFPVCMATAALSDVIQS